MADRESVALSTFRIIWHLDVTSQYYNSFFSKPTFSRLYNGKTEILRTKCGIEQLKLLIRERFPTNTCGIRSNHHMKTNRIKKTSNRRKTIKFKITDFAFRHKGYRKISFTRNDSIVFVSQFRHKVHLVITRRRSYAGSKLRETRNNEVLGNPALVDNRPNSTRLVELVVSRKLKSEYFTHARAQTS